MSKRTGLEAYHRSRKQCDDDGLRSRAGGERSPVPAAKARAPRA